MSSPPGCGGARHPARGVDLYAEIVLADGTAVDARPSDAITLALVTGAPLLVDPEVLDDAGGQSARPDLVAEAESATDDRRVLADEVRERLSRPL